MKAPKRPIAIFAIATGLLFALCGSASAATSPWWQITSSSRPTNLWTPKNEVQEVKKQSALTLVKLEGVLVACMGGSGCTTTYSLPNDETASQLQASLEAAYGAGTVAVGEDPKVPGRFTAESVGSLAGRYVSPLEVFSSSDLGKNKAKILTDGGSGRLAVSLTNVGDAPVEAGKSHLLITDTLPEGVIAHHIVGFAGNTNHYGPIKCEVKSAAEVECTYAGTLPAFEAIELEIYVSLSGEPPVAGEAGEIAVSGGGAAPASAPQSVKVSPEPTPFGVEGFTVSAEEEGGGAATQAGSHPFQLSATLQLNQGAMIPGTRLEEQPAQPRNLRFTLPAGLVGNPNGLAQCDSVAFATQETFVNECPDASAIGAASVTVVNGNLGFLHVAVPLFNLEPNAGEPARFGFMAGGVPVVLDATVKTAEGYRIVVSVDNTPQAVAFLASTVTFWGNPGDPRHDASRGWNCVYGEPHGPCTRPSNLSEQAFLRLPVSCSSALEFPMEMEPWNVPLGSTVVSDSFSSGALVGCNQVPFDPSVSSVPTSKLAESPTGLDFELSMPNHNLLNPAGIAEAQPKKVEVALPEGMTLNPSQAEGLAVCSPAQYARETAESAPGEGCPEASKIGSVQVTTPLLKEEARGALYVAAPYENPFGSLLALYLIARIPQRGVLIAQAGEVSPDPVSGQLTTSFDDAPPLPFSTFKLHFREGGRAPLVTPPSCGEFQSTVRFLPWSAEHLQSPTAQDIRTKTAPFTVQRGVDGGPCPTGGLPPFHPGLVAGTLNNAAGAFSAFNLRLTRTDSEQEITHFSIKLPPGITGKLAGIPYCPDAAIAQAKARSGPHGGSEELDSPSCPQASEIGHTLAGAGVGQVLAYVPGKLYLAGPYHGSNISIVSITSGVVGPFDIGTVVVREGLKIDPETAEVFIDSTGSDPIPHIIRGIPVHLRDIRAYVDRQNFVLNPTDCTPTSTASTLLGSGLDFTTEADDRPVTVTSPFQAADCAALPFKPKLSLRLKGGTRRGSYPAFSARLAMNGIGEAGIASAQVTLPKSEFIANAHFNTICTRVQFAAGQGNGSQCPAGSVYGKARATTPILGEALSGPVFLRSSEHQLPDLVVALHNSQVDFDLVGHVDSVKGRLRNTFEAAPDAPVSSFVLEMQGGKKGLFQNSTDLCASVHKAESSFTGQNGKVWDTKPVMRVKCGGKGKKAKRHKRRAH